jgi:hypothetical protein
MKKYKNFLFVPFEGLNSISADTSDGYITSEDGRRIKLPHKNYQILGIASECVNSAYAEEFSKEIVEYLQSGEDGYGEYRNYMEESLAVHLETAVESMKTLIERLDLKPTDYVLKEKTEPFTITIFET